MFLGFYYHIPAQQRAGKIWVPSYFGLFLDSLATQLEGLVLFLHEANPKESEWCNYPLQSANLRWVNLGIKKPAWHRSLFGIQLLQKFEREALGCNAFLVRAPTPLGPTFYKVFGKKIPMAYMLVGDYVASAPHLHLPFLRKWAIYAMSVYLDRRLKKAARHCCILSNSHEILQQFKPFSTELHLVRTTTLRAEDFFERADTFQKPPYNVLYVGRFDFAKGLRELLEACAMLLAKGIPVRLHLAGWEDPPDKPVATWLAQRAATLGISANVLNHGKKKNGGELNALYRLADVFVIPSYQEGFPRAIWEAMANSLPVIATPVGAIPHHLQDGEEALFVPPKNSLAIAEKIEWLLHSPSLRQKLIANGIAAARETTLDVQAEKLVRIVEHFWRNRAVGRHSKTVS